jgi:hypothetical protein
MPAFGVRSRSLRVAVGLSMALSLSTIQSAQGAVAVTGQNGVVASVYANPFDPNGDGVETGTEATTISFGSIGGGTVTVQFPLDNVVSRIDSSFFNGSNPRGMGSIQSGNATQGFMQFDAASSFNVGTVIGDQWIGSGYGTPSFPNMAYTMKVGGTSVQTGPGTAGPLGRHPIQVSTLAAPISASQLRIEMNLAEAGFRYANFSEAILLPDLLGRVAATPTASSGPPADVLGVYDLVGGGIDDGSGGWLGDPNSSMTLTFSKPTSVNALVIAAWETASLSPDFVIYDDTNTSIAHVTMSAKDYGAIRFDTPVTTSSLRFDFTGNAGLREVIVLTAPEPSSLLTLAASGMLLLRRRKA